jgi:hypothetical protein
MYLKNEEIKNQMEVTTTQKQKRVGGRIASCLYIYKYTE